MATMEETLEEIEQSFNEFPYEDEDATEGTRAHIFNPPMNIHVWRESMETTQEMIDLARREQLPLQALCGIILTPKRNPDKYKACDSCIAIAHQLMREEGE